MYFPPVQKTQSVIATKRNYLVSQTAGPIAKWLPHIRIRARDMEGLLASMEGGHRVVRAALILVLFSSANGTTGRFEQRCDDAIARAEVDQSGAIAFWSESMFTLMRDRFIVLPAFMNALPFCADRAAVRDLGRYRTMTMQHVARLAPIFSGWAGTGTGSVSLVSRNGALMDICRFDSGTKYNATVAAESGSGKSFLANKIIVSYLSQDAAVWVIDVGRSYLNLSEVLEAQYDDIGKEGVCFNPFPLIKSNDE
jgi:conjugal transfer ATP-binding protein TraC